MKLSDDEVKNKIKELITSIKEKKQEIEELRIQVQLVQSKCNHSDIDHGGLDRSGVSETPRCRICGKEPCFK